VTVALTDRVAAGGDAIGRLDDGRVVFVAGALPGERVVAAVTAQRRDFARAQVRSVLDASPDRVGPPCRHHDRGCGGCPWQHVALPAQRRLKERIVTDALERIGRIEAPEVLPAAPLPSEGYRTTVRVAFDRDGVPSLHRRQSDGLVDVDSCLVADPRLAALLPGLRLPGLGSARLRVGAAGAGAVGAAAAGDGVRLVVVDRHPGPAARVPADAVVVGPGQDGHVVETVGGRRWRISARSFFQAGPHAAAAIVAAVDDAVGAAVGPGGVVVDAYAGVGLIGGVVAGRRAASLVAVESDPAATADARHNLADLDAVVVTCEVGRWTPVPADVAVADPARTGLGRPGVAALVATGAARIVLVACDPASLGRDAALLAGAGYAFRRARLVDAFPYSPHVEAVATFDHLSSRRYV
jgi:23S rRNA (uracil1939-C5)-methyltransferase